MRVISSKPNIKNILITRNDLQHLTFDDVILAAMLVKLGSTIKLDLGNMSDIRFDGNNVVDYYRFRNILEITMLYGICYDIRQVLEIDGQPIDHDERCNLREIRKKYEYLNLDNTMFKFTIDGLIDNSTTATDSGVTLLQLEKWKKFSQILVYSEQS